MDSRSPVAHGNPKSPQEALYARNTGLVGAVLAHGFSGLPEAQRETAETYGRMGLWFAASRFDPARGYQFSTYATHCIRGYVLRGLERERDAGQGFAVSLDAPAGDDFALLDTLEDDPHARPGAALLAAVGFNALVSGLPRRWQEVVRAVYQDGETLSSLARARGVTPSAVNAVHQKALDQMRQNVSVDR